MVFFQAGLLLGYCYAHWTNQSLKPVWQGVVHILILALAVVLLPVAISQPALPPTQPVTWLIQTLVLTVGLPFVALASCGPLLQRWFVRARRSLPEHRRDPYFLYAASNLGSFAALVAYPLLVEPSFSLRTQAELWTAAYVALIALSLACAAFFLRSGHVGVRSAPARPLAPSSASPSPLTWKIRLRWLFLALVPSSLLLSVTTYLTTDIAAIPLLWMIPLGIYLLTFTLAFASRPRAFPTMVRWMPLVVVILAIMIFVEGTEPLLLVLGLHLLGLFWLARVCHGELSRTRPNTEHLTEFYLWLALGGALGGLFNAVLAPFLFKGLVEYPLMIALACLLRPAPDGRMKDEGGRMNNPTHPSSFILHLSRWRLDLGIPMLVGTLTLALVLAGKFLKLEPGPVSVAAFFALPLVLVYLSQNHPVRFGLGLAAVFLAGALYAGVHGPASYRQRSFFGVHRVTEQDGFRKLFHGNILHGQQSLDPQSRDEPLTYYCRNGPIGQLLIALRGDARLQRVGLIGLGTGALASYAGPGQHWTFFEIDPTVAHIAAPSSGLFTYLKNSRGRIDVVLGDARLTVSEHPGKFGLLVVDAFGSDAIPLHLLTREALRVYQAHLCDHGILAFHISNRYVDLEPVLANLAADASPPLLCLIQRDLSLDDAERKKGKEPSVWVILTKSPDDLGQLARTRWQAARARPDLRVWTDDFSDLVSVLRF
jgi:hypothetical protein